MSTLAEEIIGEHTITGPLRVRVYHRPGNPETLLTLSVRSSASWRKRSGLPWSDFAFIRTDRRVLYVWKKFRGKRSRGRSWGPIARCFVDEVLRPAAGEPPVSPRDDGC